MATLLIALSKRITTGYLPPFHLKAIHGDIDYTQWTPNEDINNIIMDFSGKNIIEGIVRTISSTNSNDIQYGIFSKWDDADPNVAAAINNISYSSYHNIDHLLHSQTSNDIIDHIIHFTDTTLSNKGDIFLEERGIWMQFFHEASLFTLSMLRDNKFCWENIEAIIMAPQNLNLNIDIEYDIYNKIFSLKDNLCMQREVSNVYVSSYDFNKQTDYKYPIKQSQNKLPVPCRRSQRLLEKQKPKNGL